MTIREFRVENDYAAVRDCFIELQEYERSLDARVPPAGPIADVYLEGLFRRCRELDGKLFVAEVNGRVVGFASVLASCRSVAPDDDATPFAYVDDLVVLPDSRGGGLGRALLGRAEAYAAERGRALLRLCVKGGNRSARKFYERAGFSEYELVLERRITPIAT